jgi:hypothetical protein
MSHGREQPFQVSKGDQGGWVVDFEGEAVPLSSHHDAMLLADLPVQLYKAVSKDQKPDPSKVERILALCDEYDLYRHVCARRLRSWFRRIKR